MTCSLLIVSSDSVPPPSWWNVWKPAKRVSPEFQLTYVPGKARIEAYPDLNFYALVSDGGTPVGIFRSECEARVFAAAAGVECEDRLRILEPAVSGEYLENWTVS